MMYAVISSIGATLAIGFVVVTLHQLSSSMGGHKGPLTKGKLIWQDEFDWMDYSKWFPVITAWRGGKSFQYYTNRSENIYVRDGLLYIKPTLTADRFGEDFLFNGILNLTGEGCNVNWGGKGCVIKADQEIINPVQSARINTAKSFSFTYGVVEVRAKMPKGDWIKPAIWLVPTYSVYGSNPRSGEIDLTEVRSNLNLSCNRKSYGRQMSGSTLHWGPNPARDAHRMTHWTKVLNGTDFSEDFHLFSVEWTRRGFTFYVDDEPIGQVIPPSGGFWELGKFKGDNIWASGSHMAPFDQPFHLVMNVAAGGRMFPDWCVNKPYEDRPPLEKPWKINDPIQMRPFWLKRGDWYPTWTSHDDDDEGRAMQVDYVRVYDLLEIDS